MKDENIGKLLIDTSKNKSIKNSKIRIPLIMLGGLILIIILKFAERKLIKR